MTSTGARRIKSEIVLRKLRAGEAIPYSAVWSEQEWATATLKAEGFPTSEIGALSLPSLLELALEAIK